MMLYAVYKDAKNAVEEKLQEMEDQKLPELKEQIIDVVKMSAVVCRTEIIRDDNHAALSFDLDKTKPEMKHPRSNIDCQ